MRFSLVSGATIVSLFGLSRSLHVPQSPLKLTPGNLLDGFQWPFEHPIDHNKIEDQFSTATVTNDKFSGYSLRVKQNDPSVLGIDTVNQYSGYLDIEEEDKHFFYWFFESRNDPKTDPLILWLNGGPGCSSMLGLFFELGPASIDANLKPVYNPYSWNSNASVIFLEQPVGVGYSYSSQNVSSTAQAGEDFYAFLELFFHKFPEYRNVPFHLAGESYGGHYVPKFATEVMMHQDRTFNLSSIMVGNGLTDSLVQYDYYQPMACGQGGHPSVLAPEKCDSLLTLGEECHTLVSKCYEDDSVENCVPAMLHCWMGFMDPYIETGLNVYDIRKNCSGDSLCYEELSYIEQFLNSPEVVEAVGSDKTSYDQCSEVVSTNFVFSGDWNKPFQQYVAELLDADIPVLLYEGDKDYICNWLGNLAWSNALEWSEKEHYGKLPLKPWTTLDGRNAGQVKNYKNFSFLRVYDAGHMVPFDQPENSLDMVNRWIGGDFSFGYK